MSYRSWKDAATIPLGCSGSRSLCCTSSTFPVVCTFHIVINCNQQWLTHIVNMNNYCHKTDKFLINCELVPTNEKYESSVFGSGSIFFVIKPTRCTNFTNIFCHETLQVSDNSSVHHQEFIHCTLSNGICHTGL